MMLAGLIDTTNERNQNGTPGLKNVPVLGTLFRSQDSSIVEKELVILVTAYLASAVGENQLSAPNDNYNEPNDRQSIIFGKLNKVYGTPGKRPRGVYHGNIGHIVE